MLQAFLIFFVMKKSFLQLIRNIGNVFKIRHEMLAIACIRILSNNILRVLNAPKAAVPVVKLDGIAYEGDNPISVARADTPYQV
jgi:hypothetical protein